jgi:hypothetical protein
MSRATFVYIIMIAVFGAGLWAIISFGSILLRAPTDLSGKWELRAPTTAADDPADHTMAVQQSGRYFNVLLDGRPHSMKLRSEEPAKRSNNVSIVVAGESMELALQGTIDGDSYTLKSDGAGAPSGVWNAKRVERTYPQRRRQHHPASQPSTEPALTRAARH